MMIDKSIHLVKNSLDVTKVLRSLQELEKLKYIFLNKDQINLFNFFPKPVIKDTGEHKILKLHDIE